MDKVFPVLGLALGFIFFWASFFSDASRHEKMAFGVSVLVLVAEFALLMLLPSLRRVLFLAVLMYSFYWAAKIHKLSCGYDAFREREWDLHKNELPMRYSDNFSLFSLSMGWVFLAHAFTAFGLIMKWAFHSRF